MTYVNDVQFENIDVKVRRENKNLATEHLNQKTNHKICRGNHKFICLRKVLMKIISSYLYFHKAMSLSLE